MLEEAERSLHDALCVVRCLVKERFLIPGGSAPEVEVSKRLKKYADSLGGLHSYCIKAFAEALEVRALSIYVSHSSFWDCCELC